MILRSRTDPRINESWSKGMAAKSFTGAETFGSARPQVQGGWLQECSMNLIIKSSLKLSSWAPSIFNFQLIHGPLLMGALSCVMSSLIYPAGRTTLGMRCVNLFSCNELSDLVFHVCSKHLKDWPSLLRRTTYSVDQLVVLTRNWLQHVLLL